MTLRISWSVRDADTERPTEWVPHRNCPETGLKERDCHPSSDDPPVYQPTVLETHSLFQASLDRMIDSCLSGILVGSGVQVHPQAHRLKADCSHLGHEARTVKGRVAAQTATLPL